MHTSTYFALLVAVAASTAAPIRRATPIPSAADIARLAPDLGVTAPLPPTGRGDCIGPVIGANGQPISVPCSCPPSRTAYIAALTRDIQAGHAVNNPSVGVSFPVGNSIADASARINAAAVSLQNLNGPGKGCPFASTTLGKQRKDLEALAASGKTTIDGGNAPAAPPAAPATKPASPASTKKAASPAATPAVPATPATNGKVTAADIARLAPDLGVKGPLPPTGFGDCKGPVNNAAGQPISVPCSCPPSREAFIAALTKDVLAGQAVNNPSVKVSFPLGDSVADKKGRINAASVTLQNLNGPGKGCPFVSTTLGAQVKALDAQSKA